MRADTYQLICAFWNELYGFQAGDTEREKKMRMEVVWLTAQHPGVMRKIHKWHRDWLKKNNKVKPKKVARH